MFESMPPLPERDLVVCCRIGRIAIAMEFPGTDNGSRAGDGPALMRDIAIDVDHFIRHKEGKAGPGLRGRIRAIGDARIIGGVDRWKGERRGITDLLTGHRGVRCRLLCHRVAVDFGSRRAQWLSTHWSVCRRLRCSAPVTIRIVLVTREILPRKSEIEDSLRFRESRALWSRCRPSPFPC